MLEGAGELRIRTKGSVCGGPAREGTGVVGPSVSVGVDVGASDKAERL